MVAKSAAISARRRASCIGVGGEFAVVAPAATIPSPTTVMSDAPLSYASAGVSIDAGNELVDEIKPLAKSTNRTGVMGSIGGFGTHVLQTLADHGALDRGLRVRTLVLPDTFIDHDSPAKMYEQAGLDAKGIVAKVFETLGKDRKSETVKLA